MNHADELECSSDEGLVWNESPSPWLWAVAAVGALICGGIVYALLPPKTPKDWGLVGMVGLFGCVAAFAAFCAFQTRQNSRRFYNNRVEVFRRGELLHSLEYKDVEKAAYAIRENGSDEFVTFSGPGGEPAIILSAVPSADEESNAASQALHQVRDLVYEAVAQRMLRQISAGGRAPWFGSIEIAAGGLYVGDSLVPWAQVQIDASEETGVVRVTTAGRPHKTAMTENNVDAGLMVLQRLHSQDGSPAQAA